MKVRLLFPAPTIREKGNTMSTNQKQFFDPRILALSEHLELSGDEYEEIEETQYGDNLFEFGHGEYLVLTDEEADQAVRENIEESVWAFNTSFLSCHVKNGISVDVINLLQEKCEDGSEAIKSLIKDFDHFVDDAVGTDGRGHFLSHYDGDEHEVNIEGEYFYIYRLN